MVFYSIITSVILLCSANTVAGLCFAFKSLSKKYYFSAFLSIALTPILLMIMFMVPPVGILMRKLLSSEMSEPIIIEYGGNIHVAPAQTNLAIISLEAMRFAP